MVKQNKTKKERNKKITTQTTNLLQQCLRHHVALMFLHNNYLNERDVIAATEIANPEAQLNRKTFEQYDA